MISTLASPSVCVIDEDEKDFRPILDALNSLYVSCVHIRGDEIEQLPPQPFRGLRLVITDLYLSSGAVGKAMASHTANVFMRVVSPDTAPVVVVIWSKHADEKIIDPEMPPEDQESEAELFKRTLLEAEPAYKERLIFIEMSKPNFSERPTSEIWLEKLKSDIASTLTGQEAVHLLWAWESLVRDSCQSVSEGLTSLVQKSGNEGVSLEEGLKETMRLLVSAEGKGDLSPATAPQHLFAVLAHLLVDQLEHANAGKMLSQHGAWLTTENNPEWISSSLVSQLNGFLLSAAVSPDATPFLPGTVYEGITDEHFKALFGVKIGELVFQSFSKRRHVLGVSLEEQKIIDKADCKIWRDAAKPVLIELSPACDVAQGTRRSAIMLAGLVLPSSVSINAKNGEAFLNLPNLTLRWSTDDFTEQNVFLMFCCRYKVTMPANGMPAWMRPWFRLRELPTASIRNWHASHASRIGYVSL